jgi:chromosome segregation ATPase
MQQPSYMYGQSNPSFSFSSSSNSNSNTGPSAMSARTQLASASITPHGQNAQLSQMMGVGSSSMREQILESKFLAAQDEIGTLRADLSRTAERAREAEIVVHRLTEQLQGEHARRTEEARQAQAKIAALQSESLTKDETGAATVRDLRAKVRHLERELSSLRHECETAQEVARNQTQLLESAHGAHREEEERIRSLYESRVTELDSMRQRSDAKMGALADLFRAHIVHMEAWQVLPSYHTNSLSQLCESLTLSIQRAERRCVEDGRLLRELVRETMDDCHALLTDYSVLRRDHASLLQSLNDMSPAATIAPQLQEANVQLQRDLEIARTTLSEDLRAARSHIEDLRDKAEQLDAARESALIEVGRLQDVLKGHATSLQESERRRAEGDLRLTEQSRRVSELTHRVAQLEELLERKTSECAILSADRDSIQARCDHAERLAEQLSDEIRAERAMVRSEMGNLQAQVDEQRNAARRTAEQLADLQRQYEALLQRANAERLRSEEYAVQVSTLKSELDTSLRRNSVLQQQVQDLLNSNSSTTVSASEMSLLQSENQRLERLLRACQLELENTRAELDTTRSNLSVTQTHRQQLQRDVEALRAAQSAAFASSQQPQAVNNNNNSALVQQLQQQLSQQQAQNATLQQQNERQRAEYDRLSRERSSSSESQGQVGELKREMEAQQRAHERTIQELRQVNTELASQLKQTQAILALQRIENATYQGPIPPPPPPPPPSA